MDSLADLQNGVLFNLQLSELVNFGGDPRWTAATHPAISQAALTYFINRAITRTMLDLADCEIELAFCTFKSHANTCDYPLPPGGTVENYYNPGSVVPAIDLKSAPHVLRVSRVIYSPVGQGWSQSHEGGIRLVSWRQFLGYSAFGYLRPFTFNTIPDYCAVTPNRKILAFYPGTASVGDTITIEYVPTLTHGTTFPPLVALTDVPILPPEAIEMVVDLATSFCWPKLREMGAAKEYEARYAADTVRVREQLGPRSRGDTFVLRDAAVGLAQSYPIGGGMLLP
jgi:hypothetical protein